MILRAHGLAIELPSGWEGRIYKRERGDPTLHAANFPLPAHDGDFGTRATSGMPPGGIFLVLTEYRPGGGLEPGRGLFASERMPLPLDLDRFSERALLRARPGQAGFQHFFTHHGRPFCLYAVVRRPASRRATAAAIDPHGLRTLNTALGTVEIAPT